MAKTPFIRPLQVQGGTFYTFSSAAEDLAFTFNNSVNKFRFSKFALLNIPDISTTASQDNTVKLNAPDSAFIDWSTATYNLVPSDANIAFSQSFQSYCLNLETTTTSKTAMTVGSLRFQSTEAPLLICWRQEEALRQADIMARSILRLIAR